MGSIGVGVRVGVDDGNGVPAGGGVGEDGVLRGGDITGPDDGAADGKDDGTEDSATDV